MLKIVYRHSERGVNNNLQNGEVFSVFYKDKWTKLYKANEFIAYCNG